MAFDDSNYVAMKTSTGVGERCEIRLWQQRCRKDGTLEKTEKDVLGDEDLDADKLFAITATQVLSKENVFDHTDVQINSTELLKAFREDDLEVYRQQVKDDVTRMHLNLLFDFMRAEIGPDRDRCNYMIRKKQAGFSNYGSSTGPETYSTWSKTGILGFLDA
ncbi:hypothetical protein MMC18_004799 [Xylographa bjoerkii]|nr:hypothetical protein [Xylographa bjoerkii]